MAAIFQNGRPEYILFNISTSRSLRIVILVSKHTYLGARIPTELIANTYLHEIGSHFPKWRLKYNFFNISASSSLRIVILVSKHTYLGVRIPIEVIANTYPAVYHEFLRGNFTVKKTGRAFSIDQAHEQNNACVKDDGGAVGLTQNPQALQYDGWCLDQRSKSSRHR